MCMVYINSNEKRNQQNTHIRITTHYAWVHSLSLSHVHAYISIQQNAIDHVFRLV